MRLLRIVFFINLLRLFVILIWFFQEKFAFKVIRNIRIPKQLSIWCDCCSVRFRHAGLSEKSSHRGCCCAGVQLNFFLNSIDTNLIVCLLFALKIKFYLRLLGLTLGLANHLAFIRNFRVMTINKSEFRRNSSFNP